MALENFTPGRERRSSKHQPTFPVLAIGVRQARAGAPRPRNVREGVFDLYAHSHMRARPTQLHRAHFASGIRAEENLG